MLLFPGVVVAVMRVHDAVVAVPQQAAPFMAMLPQVGDHPLHDIATQKNDHQRGETEAGSGYGIFTGDQNP